MLVGSGVRRRRDNLAVALAATHKAHTVVIVGGGGGGHWRCSLKQVHTHVYWINIIVFFIAALLLLLLLPPPPPQNTLECDHGSLSGSE